MNRRSDLTFNSGASTIHCYYSRERLESDEARRAFVEPDLKPLPPQV